MKDRMRVEELARRCGVSVDTVRFYQSKGLLPAPARRGRFAWYGREHLRRIRRIRELREQGLTLRVIARVLEGRLGRAGQELARAVAHAEGEHEEFLTTAALAARSGVPAAVLEAVEREGVSLGRMVDGEMRYTAADVEVVRLGLRMLEMGLPMTDLIELAARHHAQVRETAERAVALFDAHVRAPIRAQAASDEEAAERLVEAFRALLPAATTLVGHHFRRVLLAVAQEHIERVGDEAEVAATRAEARRRLEAVPS